MQYYFFWQLVYQVDFVWRWIFFSLKSNYFAISFLLISYFFQFTFFSLSTRFIDENRRLCILLLRFLSLYGKYMWPEKKVKCLLWNFLFKISLLPLNWSKKLICFIRIKNHSRCLGWLKWIQVKIIQYAQVLYVKLLNSL